MDKIDLTWVNDKHRTLTEEERKEVQEFCEKHKNTGYHYPVRSSQPNCVGGTDG